MELSRIKYLSNLTEDDLTKESVIEDLIYQLGTNTENPHELPTKMIQYGGGLRIWQYPIQFSKYLCFLFQQNINSYLEIGCRWGGTFVCTCEYIMKQNKNLHATAVDIIDSPVEVYCNLYDNIEFLKINSQDEKFKEYITNNKFDAVLIDGDHSYEGVKNDFALVKDSRVIILHDISSVACPGVVLFWNELKTEYKDTHRFIEFVDQYPEVLERTGNKYLGIGVMIKNE